MNMPRNFDLGKLQAEPNHKELLKNTLKERPVGRPKKEKSDKMSAKVILSFTLDELAHIKKKAGRIPLATYLRDELQKNGIIK